MGPKLGALFNARGIKTAEELLYFFPRAYEDRSQIHSLRQLQVGQKGSIQLFVIQQRKIPIRGRFQSIFEVRCRDSEGLIISLKWFKVFKGFETKFTLNTEVIATGLLKKMGSQFEMIHPELDFEMKTDLIHTGRIVPVYVEVDGVSTRVLRSILWHALELASHDIKEDLPPYLQEKYSLPTLKTSLNEIHFPSESKDFENYFLFRTPAHQRLIYEEFFKFEFLVLRQKLNHQHERAIPFDSNLLLPKFSLREKRLPFQLTLGQKNAISEIFQDLQKNFPMNRLIQGDVGCGKTAVALLTCFAVLDQGAQAALMAPTEILAEQHLLSARKLFPNDEKNICLLTGKTTINDRRVLQARLARGESLLVIGTHALLEDPVEFSNLCYVLIDEQHRFGVEQRLKLKRKAKKGFTPHTLVLSATPIPRTLALTAYGDLSISSIRERPVGRLPILTRLVLSKQRERVYQFVRNEIDQGRQAYFVYPLVNESEDEKMSKLLPATTEAEKLSKMVFPDKRVGLLHGQMKSDEKIKIMESFRSNEIQILVSTTLIEVGVDVPNASVLVIENAERFGLSQLHQLRGRVGRGQHSSYCFLISDSLYNPDSKKRLEIMTTTEDGFKIAEADLEIRGPGEFLGTRQAGTLPFHIANLVRDQDWLLRARADALDILKNDPKLQTLSHAPLRNYLEREGKIQNERLST